MPSAAVFFGPDPVKTSYFSYVQPGEVQNCPTPNVNGILHAFGDCVGAFVPGPGRLTETPFLETGPSLTRGTRPFILSIRS
jgi:hypothetical protein